MTDVVYHVTVQEEDGTRRVEDVTLAVTGDPAAVQAWAGTLGSDYEVPDYQPKTAEPAPVATPQETLTDDEREALAKYRAEKEAK